MVKLCLSLGSAEEEYFSIMCYKYIKVVGTMGFNRFNINDLGFVCALRVRTPAVRYSYIK